MTEEQIDKRVFNVNLLIAIVIGALSGFVFGGLMGIAIIPNLLITVALVVLYNIVVSGPLSAQIRENLRAGR